MTARTLIDRRFRKVMLVAFLGMALFIGAMIGDKALGMPVWIWWPGLLGFGVAWVTMMGAYAIGLFRCPKCRGNLTPLLMQSGKLRMDPRIRYCPFCSLDLDAECDGGAAIGAP